MDLVLKLLDTWNARDLDTFVDFLTDDVEWHDPAMADPPARMNSGDSIHIFLSTIFCGEKTVICILSPEFTLMQEGIRKICLGLTDLSQVRRVCMQ